LNQSPASSLSHRFRHDENRYYFDTARRHGCGTKDNGESEMTITGLTIKLA